MWIEALHRLQTSWGTWLACGFGTWGTWGTWDAAPLGRCNSLFPQTWGPFLGGEATTAAGAWRICSVENLNYQIVISQRFQILHDCQLVVLNVLFPLFPLFPPCDIDNSWRRLKDTDAYSVQWLAQYILGPTWRCDVPRCAKWPTWSHGPTVPPCPTYTYYACRQHVSWNRFQELPTCRMKQSAGNPEKGWFKIAQVLFFWHFMVFVRPKWPKDM